MSNLAWGRLTAERDEHPRARGFDRYDQYELDPPKPLDMFIRLGVLLMIALAFALAAQLLVQLPLH
jgi:hypothetical protein